MSALRTGSIFLQDFIHTFFRRAVSFEAAFPIFLAALFITFIPDEVAARLGVAGLRQSYPFVMGFALLFSGAAVVSQSILGISRFIWPWIAQALSIRNYQKGLKKMTSDEKTVLRKFIIDGESTVYLRISNGTINLLAHKSIVKRASNVAAHSDSFPWILQPWAREYLEKHPELIED